MADESLVEQLVTLRKLLDEFDRRLARAPAAPAGLEDLKHTVDTLRTNMWAVLSAGRGAIAPVRVERLKLRRAIEGLKAIQAGLRNLQPGALQPEHSELRLIARELVEEIDRLLET